MDFTTTQHNLGRKPGKDKSNVWSNDGFASCAVRSGVDLPAAVAALTKITEDVEIVRWIELSAAVLLFLLVPGDPDSGAVYVLDRMKGTWYAIDFEDEQFPGYSVTHVESLLNECKFLDLIERPGLWRTGLPWVVAPGTAPEAAV